MKTRTTIILAAVTLFTSTNIFAEGYWHKFNIQEATSQDVKDCRRVGEVEGHSSDGKTTKQIWKEKAKHEAMKHANELNATHIVWTDDSTGYESGRFVSGNAYICNE
jgi:hypothetical protein